jgi:ubiquinone/menaquinone biosynthesis C-methylase UbiE
MAQYSKQEYWDDRYLKDLDYFDWYQRYNNLKDLIKEHINPKCNILNIGCGNSRLSEEMYDDGYTSITNIDFSTVAIKQLVEKYKASRPSLKFIAMDARKLEFTDSSFDAIIDKGTLDSILCGENSSQNANMMLKEIERALAPGGVYMCISFGLPEQREPHFKKLLWEIKTSTIAKPQSNEQEEEKAAQYFYIYIYRKKDDGSKPKETKATEVIQTTPAPVEAKEQSDAVKADTAPKKEEPVIPKIEEVKPQEEVAPVKVGPGHHSTGTRSFKVSSPISLDLKKN